MILQESQCQEMLWSLVLTAGVQKPKHKIKELSTFCKRQFGEGHLRAESGDFQNLGKFSLPKFSVFDLTLLS